MNQLVTMNENNFIMIDNVQFDDIKLKQVDRSSKNVFTEVENPYKKMSILLHMYLKIYTEENYAKSKTCKGT